MQAIAAVPPAKRKQGTQADNRAQGARYLTDILKTLPGEPTLEAWASAAAAAAASTGNNGWENLSVKARIEEVMCAFKGRG